MKILYFTNIPSPYRVEFFNLLSENNEVTVLFDKIGEKKEKRNKLWYESNKYKFRAINIPKFGLFKLNKVLKEKYDIVIIGTYATLNGAFLNILLRMKKIKFFINADGGFVPEKESFMSKFLKHYFLSTADYYLSTGKETNKYLTYYGAKKEKIYIYPFTSLLAKDILQEPITYEEKMKIRKNNNYNYERIFVSVGSFIKRKGYDLFLESIKNEKFDNTAFLIIGGGEEKENLQNYINNNNIKNVFLIDFCSKEKVLNYYKMSDVFFFPSREDIWGLVINEAMSYGLPIISSNNVIAAKELLEEEYLYDYNDTNALRKLILEMNEAQNEKLYEIGNKNIEKIKEYTIENTVKIHNEIFEKIKRKEENK